MRRISTKGAICLRTWKCKIKLQSYTRTLEIDGKSRFMVDGENQSLSILVSSAQYDSSFTNQRIKELKNDPHAYIVNAKIYDVKPHNYSTERFYVFTGSGELDPMIIDTMVEVNSILESYGKSRVEDPNADIKSSIELLPTEIQSKILTVPVDFYNDFKNNLVKSIQDIARRVRSWRR